MEIRQLLSLQTMQFRVYFPAMPQQKPTVSARITPELAERIERVAQVDRRKPSHVIEMLIERALPQFEAELKARGHLTTAALAELPAGTEALNEPAREYLTNEEQTAAAAAALEHTAAAAAAPDTAPADPPTADK